MSLYNTTTRDEFDAHVLNSNKLVLVDFWATWCPPCLAMAPILHKISEAMDKDVDIVKVDVEASMDNGQLAQQHGVQGVPNMQLYKDGKVVDMLVGMRPEAVLIDELKSHLK